jgi:hypothetical protein
MCDKFQQGFLQQNLKLPFFEGITLRGTNEDLCHLQSMQLNNQSNQRYHRCISENDSNCHKILERSLASSENRLQNCLSVTKK